MTRFSLCPAVLPTTLFKSSRSLCLSLHYTKALHSDICGIVREQIRYRRVLNGNCTRISSTSALFKKPQADRSSEFGGSFHFKEILYNDVSRKHTILGSSDGQFGLSNSKDSTSHELFANI